MRNAVVGSTLVHALLTLALLVLRPSREILVPGPDVVQVGLVDATLAPTPPAPAVRSAPESVTPAEDKGVQIEKPKKTRAKPQPQHEEARAAEPPHPAAPAAPTSPASIVLPYASIGGGMRGQVAVDESNFEFAYYLQQVRIMIARNWTPTGGMAGARVEVYFRVSRDGTLSAPRIETSSGNAYFDQSAARAVILTGHLPPLPLGYAGSDLGIHFGFEHTGS